DRGRARPPAACGRENLGDDPYVHRQDRLERTSGGTSRDRDVFIALCRLRLAATRPADEDGAKRLVLVLSEVPEVEAAFSPTRPSTREQNSCFSAAIPRPRALGAGQADHGAARLRHGKAADPMTGAPAATSC